MEYVHPIYLFCIDNHGMEKYLTLNKSYEIEDTLKDSGRFKITDDNGKECHAHIGRFSDTQVTDYAMKSRSEILGEVTFWKRHHDTEQARRVAGDNEIMRLRKIVSEIVSVAEKVLK